MTRQPNPALTTSGIHMARTLISGLLRRWAAVVVPSPERQVIRALRKWDAAMFRRIAGVRSPVLAIALPAVSRAADRSLLWLAISGVLMASRRRSVHRAARRGLVTLTVAGTLNDALANGPFRAADRSGS